MPGRQVRGLGFVYGSGQACLHVQLVRLEELHRRILQGGYAPRFVEGNYATFLLAADLPRPSPRFGYAGRLKRLTGAGLGVAVDPRKVARYGTLIKTLHA